MAIGKTQYHIHVYVYCTWGSVSRFASYCDHTSAMQSGVLNSHIQYWLTIQRFWLVRKRKIKLLLNAHYHSATIRPIHFLRSYANLYVLDFIEIINRLLPSTTHLILAYIVLQLIVKFGLWFKVIVLTMYVIEIINCGVLSTIRFGFWHIEIYILYLMYHSRFSIHIIARFWCRATDEGLLPEKIVEHIL